MPRKKKSETAQTPPPAPAQTEATAPVGVWQQPKLRVAPDAPPVQAPTAPQQPTASAQPTIRVEQVPGTERPTGRIVGYDESVAAYIERDRKVKDDTMHLEEGKSWFRTMAKKFLESHGLETLLFSSQIGTVTVAHSTARRALEEELAKVAEQSVGLASLLESTETIEPGKFTTYLLDNSFIKTPDGQLVTLRQAVQLGLNVKVGRKVTLKENYKQLIAPMKEALSPNEKELLSQLEAAGLNAPTVKAS